MAHASSSQRSMTESSPRPSVEEREGLLKNADADDDYYKTETASGIYNRKGIDGDAEQGSAGWSRKKIIWAAALLINLLLLGVFARALLRVSPMKQHHDEHPNLTFHGQALRSNGTHDFKRTVLVVSIDGLRADYLDRGLTPHLLDIAKQGLRAKSMIPIFPTLTFPNHWALMTGLYAESHGIIANNFWDPVSKSEFHYNQISSAWISEFWLGEPMWETAGKAGVITANLMWPGPPKTTSGASPTYFVPWKDKVPLATKLDQILAWIDLPLEERPQLIMAYEPSLDQAGHLTGPMSELVNRTLVTVDVFARTLHESLAARNLSDIVDVVFVSDHGMADTSHPTHIYVDDEDMLGPQGVAAIEHEDGWPAMGLRFNTPANESFYLEKLLKAEKTWKKIHGEDKKAFHVYTKETMPERWHFSKSERIAPIWIVPRLGYVLTTREQGDVGLSKGNHGYDNHEHSMHAMFVAHGPFSAVVKALHQSRRSLLPRSMLTSRKLSPWKNKGWHSTSDDTYIMDRFRNVEIYGLVMKLLGIEEYSKGKANGTIGFWDQYF
ncbi:Phosphodiest-domain-containing protein [Marasmius fiardii PR-910]|nr:Phosphodiest-domain-containing protein [Marasmius fiardii PR-910]